MSGENKCAQLSEKMFIGERVPSSRPPFSPSRTLTQMISFSLKMLPFKRVNETLDFSRTVHFNGCLQTKKYVLYVAWDVFSMCSYY